jgi:uncharacterized protein HemY
MENQSGANQKKRSPFFWFMIGWMFLFLMAFTWTIDGIPSICLGLAAILFFVGYWNSPRFKVNRPFENTRSPVQAESPRASFRQPQTHAMPSRPLSASTRRVVWIACGSIGFVFIAIVFPIFFGAVDTSADEDATFGTQYYDEQQYDSARALFKRALRKDPENIKAIIGYGNVLWYFNNEDSALTMFEKALSLEPENDYASYRKAGVLSKSRRFDQAAIELKKLLERNPAYYEAMQLMGDTYYEQDNYDEALRWYEDAYANGVRNRWICHLLAYLYDRKNEIPKALPLYREALSYDSSNIDVYLRLGELIPGREGDFFRERGAALQQE